MPDLFIGNTLIPAALVRTLMRESIDGDTFAGKLATRCLEFTRADHIAAIRWYWRFA